MTKLIQIDLDGAENTANEIILNAETLSDGTANYVLDGDTYNLSEKHWHDLTNGSCIVYADKTLCPVNDIIEMNNIVKAGVVNPVFISSIVAKAVYKRLLSINEANSVESGYAFIESFRTNLRTKTTKIVVASFFLNAMILSLGMLAASNTVQANMLPMTIYGLLTTYVVAMYIAMQSIRSVSMSAFQKKVSEEIEGISISKEHSKILDMMISDETRSFILNQIIGILSILTLLLVLFH